MGLRVLKCPTDVLGLETDKGIYSAVAENRARNLQLNSIERYIMNLMNSKLLQITL